MFAKANAKTNAFTLLHKHTQPHTHRETPQHALPKQKKYQKQASKQIMKTLNRRTTPIDRELIFENSIKLRKKETKIKIIHHQQASKQGIQQKRKNKLEIKTSNKWPGKKNYTGKK